MSTATKPASKPKDDAFRLAREIEAATVLRDRYKEVLGDDAELIADTIEGETSLFEKMEAMLQSIAEDNAMIEANKAFEKQIKERRQRFERRVEMKRALLLTAMQIADVRKREFPVATISRTAVGDKLIIVEEADIPSTYFEPVPPPPPELDKKKLLAALKERRDALALAAQLADPEARTAALRQVDVKHPAITGAELGNGGDNISVRFS